NTALKVASGEAKETTEENIKIDFEKEKSDFVDDMNETEDSIVIGYKFPPTSLLKITKGADRRASEAEMDSTAEHLVETLRSFGVETRIVDISKGPTVTRYELQPCAGVKISKITNLADDIALNLATAGVRIEAPIPNKAAVGIEVPNKASAVVGVREIIESSAFVASKSKLTVAMGRDIGGNVVVADIAKMPHGLIAGATGSGKSVCINSIVMSILYKASPEEVKLLMIDPKVVELGVYNGIPHLLVPVVTEPRKAAGALGWAVSEMEKRYQMFADRGVRDIEGYNRFVNTLTDEPEVRRMPHIVIIIDELADLMMTAPSEVEDSINRIAAKARAAGMHLLIATQRPSVDVVTGVIKANIPSRIAFAVSSQIDSRTILDTAGAEKLLGRGDMLFSPVGSTKPKRLQGCYVSDEEVEKVVEFIKTGGTADYDDNIMVEIERQAAVEKQKKTGLSEDGPDEDPMLNDAIKVVVENGQASTSLLQRRLKLGYARAARIIDEMETRGVVGPYEGSKPRKVLITKEQLMEREAGEE
ncbi:MAG: DNA translocase FtsK, partial [Clostridia bacterium]|nr:DNA translocase FtsK [Clostridia bacterium]